MGQRHSVKSKLICWDTSVLIEWIKGEGKVNDKSQKDKVSKIRTVVDYLESNSCKIVFSTLVYTEVLEGTMSEQAVVNFKNLMANREIVEILAVDIRVAEKAGTIRNKSQKKISAPDAIHIATAIISGAEAFHTFDKKLLRLNGKDEVNKLAITDCDISGMTLSMF